MKKLLPKYLVAYLAWAIFIVLGLISIIISRTSLGTILRTYYAGDDFQRGKEVMMLDRVYLLVMGIALLILLIVVEEYFKNGARNNTLFRRIARVFGIEVLFFLLGSFASAYLVGFSILVAASLALELLIAILLLWLGYRTAQERG